jgi:hypothetical protein
MFILGLDYLQFKIAKLSYFNSVVKVTCCIFIMATAITF